MEISVLKLSAKKKMKDFCVLCSQCNGIWCAGKVPGMGGAGSGDSFKNSYNKLKEIKLIMRTIHNIKEPKLKTKLFGEVLSFPVIGAPITGAKFNMGGGVTEEEYCLDVINGAIAEGTISMIGDTGDPSAFNHGLNAIKNNDGKGIAIIKPRSNEEIMKRIKMSEEANCIAVGIDIDGAGLITMKLFNQPVGPKTIEDLKILVDSTKLPFIVKGILSVDEALLCVQAGVSAIVVSNHGGRVLNDTLASVEVLENIVESVGNKITVLADGNIREGIDVLKYLALGAKGVLVGRPLIWGSVGGREDGVKTIFRTLRNELTQAMILTGVESTTKVEKKIIHKN
ncbi:MAG: alpha-hydroxy-acid oxidizing protein [Fusobacteriaceae bacterium]